MKRSKKAKQEARKSSDAKQAWLWIVLPLLLAGVIAFSIQGCGDGSNAPEKGAAGALQAPAAYASLLGRWVRPDGGYVMAINKISPEGTVEAAYFNPNPIHVERGSASRDGDEVRLFLELRDTGYPGCTYKLTYKKDQKQLVGTYFQAAQNQSYEIYFEREQ